MKSIFEHLAVTPRALSQLAVAFAATVAIIMAMTAAVVVYFAITGTLPNSRLITEHEPSIYIGGGLLFFAVSVIYSWRRAE